MYFYIRCGYMYVFVRMHIHIIEDANLSTVKLNIFRENPQRHSAKLSVKGMRYHSENSPAVLA